MKFENGASKYFGFKSKRCNHSFYACNNSETNQNSVYDFMLRVAEEFHSEPQILKMFFNYGGLSIKIIADEQNNKIFSLYGCDEDGMLSSKQPICIGNADEIVSYLNDKNNIDDVMKQILINENV